MTTGGSSGVSNGHGPILRIAPDPLHVATTLSQIWSYRHLLVALVARDLKLRYRQTLIGTAWVVLQPLALMLVFTLFLGILVRVPVEGISYPLFVYSGVVVWQYFSRTLEQAGTSLKESELLINQVYFPKLIAPLSFVIGGLVDLCINVVVVAVLAAVLGEIGGASLLMLPLWIGFAALLALAFGLWLSVLDVRFRDMRHALPFLLQLWMFSSPVIYPVTLVPHDWRYLYLINPLALAVEGMRSSLIASAEASSETPSMR